MTDKDLTAPEAVGRVRSVVQSALAHGDFEEIERVPLEQADEMIEALSAALEAEKARAETTEAERDTLKAQLAEAVGVIQSQIGSVLYPEDRSGYETVEEMRKRHAEERALAVKVYVGAKDDDEAVAMSHSSALSVIRGARKRLEDREKIARAFLTRHQKETGV